MWGQINVTDLFLTAISAHYLCQNKFSFVLKTDPNCFSYPFIFQLDQEKQIDTFHVFLIRRCNMYFFNSDRGTWHLGNGRPRAGGTYNLNLLERDDEEDAVI